MNGAAETPAKTGKKRRPPWARALIVVASAWLGLVVLAALFYPFLLYHPDKTAPNPTPGSIGLRGFEETWLVAPDGARLHGWFVEANPEAATGTTLLAFHGNAGNLATALPRFELYARHGFDVFMIEYHGFGLSDGKPNEKNLYLDAETAWEHLTADRRIPPENIVILGYSLGGAVASHLALQHPEAAGLILESTFTSLADMGSHLFPFLPSRLVLGNMYDTAARLRNMNMPILFIHGRGDRLVPFINGINLFNAYNGPKDFFVIGDDHNLGFIISGETYGEALAIFAATYAKQNVKK